VSRASQIYVTGLLEAERVRWARNSIAHFYAGQRERYGELLSRLGFELETGDGGFYHWGKIPGGVTADTFNESLFPHGAAILPGRLCDMHRRSEDDSPHARFARFSFGPLPADSFDTDAEILSRVIGAAIGR
jgi:DNA-binding transcriptional MocR family regulator